MLFLLRFIKVGISILLAKKSLVGNCCLSAVRKISEIINRFFKLEFLTKNKPSASVQVSSYPPPRPLIISVHYAISQYVLS